MHFYSGRYEWREPGCSMCLAMNADRLLPGERQPAPPIATLRPTRQWLTHLVSPAMAAAAVAGHFVPVEMASSQ